MMMSAAAAATKAGGDRMVPLAVLLKRELTSEKIEKPEILLGLANQMKKGEDFTLVKTECQRHAEDGVSTFSVFAVITWQCCLAPRLNPVLFPMLVHRECRL